MLCRMHEMKMRRGSGGAEQSIPLQESTDSNTPEQSSVMRTVGTSAFRRSERAAVAQPRGVTWSLPDPSVQLYVIDRSAPPQLESLTQDEKWTHQMRQHPQAAPYMPAEPTVQSISTPLASVEASPNLIISDKVQTEPTTIEQVVNAGSIAFEQEKMAAGGSFPSINDEDDTLQKGMQQAALSMQTHSEQSDASMSTTQFTQCEFSSDVSVGVLQPAEEAPEANASNDCANPAEAATRNLITNSPSDLDFENFLLRTPEYGEVGMRAPDIPLPCDNVETPDNAMETDVQEGAMRDEQSANQASFK